MGDVVIAGVFGIFGVLASGATQIALAIRADRRKTVGAKREVRYELTDLVTTLLVVESEDQEFAAAMQATILPAPVAFEKHASLLAQGLRQRQWAAVQVAYGRYAMVRRGVESSNAIASSFARDRLVASAIEECVGAVAALTPRRQRADDARGLKELRDRASRIAETGTPTDPGPQNHDS